MLSRIGKYEIKAELGHGGCGRVYRAYDPTVGRMVALKVLLSEAESDVLTRFRHEAAAAGKLHHKNIVTIHEFGEQDGMPYLVMELLEGSNLQQLIDSRAQLSGHQKLRILYQVAEGLDYAHRHGIIHRDVKPGNVMLLDDGNVKILDFGIARIVHSQTTRVTQQGGLLGTIRYMSPELLNGKEADGRSDIFAYGVMLFEALTGTHPFDGREVPVILGKILTHTPPAVSSVCLGLPDTLDPIVSKALEKNPDDRYQTFEDLRFDLQSVLLELQQQRVNDLLPQARALLDNDDLDTAEGVIREALDLDPGNRDAYRLREEHRRRVHRRKIQPQVDALVETGTGHLTRRDCPAALASFESALRLDNSNAGVRGLIEQVRELQRRMSEAQALLENARAAESTDLDRALQIAQLAHQADPESAAVSDFLSSLHDRIQLRDHQQAGLLRATQMLRASEFRQAIAHLEKLHTDFPNSADVQALLEEARRQQADKDRRQALEIELAECEHLLTQRRTTEAIARLEQVIDAHSQSGDAQRILETALHQAAKESEAEALLHDARAAQANDLDRAMEIAQTAQHSDPGNAAVHDLLSSLQARIADRDRRRAGLLRATQMLGAAEFRQAIAQLEKLDTEFPDSADVQALLQKALRQQADDDRRKALEAELAESKRLLDQRQMQQAVARLQALVQSHPESAEADQLLKDAHRLAAKETEALTLLDEARNAESHDLDQALQIAQLAHQADPESDPVREFISSRMERRNRRESGLQRAAQLLEARSIGQAIAHLEKLDTEFPNSANVRSLLDKSRLQHAEEERRKAFAAESAECERLLNRRHTAEAITRLESLLEKEPQSTEARHLLEVARRRAADEKIEQARRAEFEQAVTIARGSLAKGEARAALDALQTVGALDAKDPKIRELVKKAKDALQRQNDEARRRELDAQRRAEETRHAEELRDRARKFEAQKVLLLQELDNLSDNIESARSARDLQSISQRAHEIRVELRSQPDLAAKALAVARRSAAKRRELIYRTLTSPLTIYSRKLILGLSAIALAGVLVTQWPRKTEIHETRPAVQPAPPKPQSIEPEGAKAGTGQRDRELHPFVEQGRLLLQANVDGAAIYIGQKRYSLSTKDGTLAIPLDPQHYSIRLEKSGYVSEPSTSAIDVKSGETTKLAFRLQPIPAPKPQTLEQPAPQTVTLPPSPKAIPAPATPPQPSEEALEQAQWDRARASMDPIQLTEFLKRFPSGRYADRARQELERQETERTSWESLNHKDNKALRDWAARFPNTARARLAVSEAEALERAQKENELQRADADRQAILKLIEGYRGAYLSRDLRALSAIWPDMSEADKKTFRSIFGSFKKGDGKITPLGPPQIQGDTAAVRCNFEIGGVGVDGRRLPAHTDLITFYLVRHGSNWAIHEVK